MHQVRVVAHDDRQEPLLESGFKQQLQQQGGHLQVRQQCFVLPLCSCDNNDALCGPDLVPEG